MAKKPKIVRAVGRGSSDPRPSLGSALGGLLMHGVTLFATLEPQRLTAEQLAAEVRTFLDAYKTWLNKGAEHAYVAKRMAEFFFESTLMALRRRRPVPLEHAATLEAGLQAVVNSRTSLSGDTDTSSIDDIERDARQLVASAMKRYGPRKIVIG